MPLRRCAHQGFAVDKVALLPKERTAEPQIVGWAKMVFELEVEVKTSAQALPPCVNITQVLCELASSFPYFRASKRGTPLLPRQSHFSLSTGGIDQDRPLTPKNVEPLFLFLPMGYASAPQTLFVCGLDRVNAFFSPWGVHSHALLLLLLLSKALPNDCLSWSHLLTMQNEPSCCIGIRTWPLSLAHTTINSNILPLFKLQYIIIAELPIAT